MAAELGIAWLDRGVRRPAAGRRPPAAAQAGLDPERDRIAGLVTLAQQGDGEAFGQVYDAYVDQIYRYLYYRVGSHALAEDLTSETFLRALRRIDSFTWQGKDIGAWFTTIARNLVDRPREVQPLQARGHDGGHARRRPGRRRASRPRCSTGCRTPRCWTRCSELKPEQQECIVLRFLQGLSVAETAEVHGPVRGSGQAAAAARRTRAGQAAARERARPMTGRWP